VIQVNTVIKCMLFVGVILLVKHGNWHPGNERS